MSLRTAPCPRCQSLVVFGERQCRTCAMPFDYGSNPPPVPSASDVFDTLMSADLPPTSPPSPSPTPPRSATSIVAPALQEPSMPTLEGLDTGRLDVVGDVEVEEIPGFIDSTLYAAWTPRDVQVAPLLDLETTATTTPAVRTQLLPDLDRTIEVGDVVTEAVPGLFGSDLFRTDVDFAAGASASAALDVTPNTRKAKVRTSSSERRVACASCGTVHAFARCPSCGTAVPDDS
jgi:hypothetical protein